MSDNLQDIGKLKALIVDGLGSIRKELETLLMASGITDCLHASNEADAKMIFDNDNPEIVIMNQEFIQLVKKIKNDDESVARIIYSETVIINGHDGAAALKGKFKQDFNHYIKKSLHDAHLRVNDLQGVKQDKTRYRVLVVEDDAIAQMILQEGLLEANYEICGTAGTEENAYSAYCEKKPDILLLDMYMEREDSGLRVLEKISAFENKKIPAAVVIMTAHAESDLIMNAFKLGADEYILKNSSEGRVLTGIKRALAKKNL